ncbi:unnamed protein product [Caenorhabditis angaria]|uniref:Uncharacterized protein n=1 Tax=Caenorhabditis angaria TaxID=860376 RepID=A0A9P1IK76_9PELO|nr:unnamed protein product [Caenorhabditis angaria]
MRKLRELREVVEKLAEMHENLEKCEEWTSVAQEVLQKLSTIRKECERIQFSSLITPPQSTSSGSLSSDTISITMDTVYTEAVEAYEQQIYSRCVRLVENANRESPVDMYLISLAHNSYSEMVDAAGTSNEAMRFAKWWAEFLDSVEAGRAHNEKIELLDYETIALERIVKLGGGPEEFEKLVEVAVRNFEMVTLLNRPYHIISVERLVRLGNVLETENNNNAQKFTSEAREVFHNGIQNTLKDRKKYLQTGKIEEKNVLEIDKILKKLTGDDNLIDDDIVLRL